MQSNSMQNEKTFPDTRQDIDNLKRTASDAAADISSAAAPHVGKAKGQLTELAGHARAEVGDRLGQVQGSFADVVDSAKGYVTAKPWVAVGIAVGVGVVLAMLFRGRSDD
jgi:ElaB/YqjD/DUF883 family membrane-anchored ribosome-binding protein